MHRGEYVFSARLVQATDSGDGIPARVAQCRSRLPEFPRAACDIFRFPGAPKVIHPPPRDSYRLFDRPIMCDDPHADIGSQSKEHNVLNTARYLSMFP